MDSCGRAVGELGELGGACLDGWRIGWDGELSMDESLDGMDDG